jgi:hypothetical protein
MEEADLLSSVWWDAATAVTYLRDGTVPHNFADVDWQLLPTAKQEVQLLNAALQAGEIDLIEIMMDGTRAFFSANPTNKDRDRLKIEDIATLAVRFRQKPFAGGVGVVLEVEDVGKRQRDIQRMLLRAEQIRALRERVATKSPKQRKTKSQHERLIDLMRELKLDAGMLPREVRKAIKLAYKNKYHEEPSDSAIDRAYRDYLSAN